MRLSTIILLIIIIYSCTNSDSKIYQWRGENRDGVFLETNLLKQWPKEGPELLWSVDTIGRGYGSPAITNDRVYVNGEIDSIGYLFALSLSGEIIYKVPYGKEWTKNFPGSRSTPTVVGDFIYVCSGEGNIVCFKSENGEKVWSLNMVEDLNGMNNMFGYSQSLLIDDDFLFCSPGGKDTNVVALDRFTGEVQWTNKALGQISAYCSPIIHQYAGKKMLMTFSELAFLVFNSQTGELLWTHPMDTTGNMHCNTPILVDDYLYYVTGDGNRAVKLKLTNDGNSFSEVWRNRSFDNIMGGVVKVGNSLIGTGHRKKFLKKLDMDTGEVSDILKIGRGTTIYADSLIYLYTDRGEMKLVNPEGKMKEISSFKITKGTKQHFAYHAIKNGILYVRHGKSLMAYNIKA